MSRMEVSENAAVLELLAGAVEGHVVRPGDASYDEARNVWNGMIDLKPEAVVECASSADVVRALAAARGAGLAIAVRGGGHNVAGLGTIDAGLVVDLSPMTSVSVDPERRLVRVAGGATLDHLDAATQAHGLAVPAGVVSETGVAGLTLSGGFGWLRRAYGLTCDNLVAAEIVTAAGEVVHVDEENDPELLWGLAGGGGNFGVVTEFTFRAHQVGPEVYFLFTLYPIELARHVLTEHECLVHEIGDALSTIAILGHVPPLEDFPADVHDAPYVGVLGMYAGPPAAGERAVQPLRALGTPLVDLSDRVQYVDAQKIYDPDYPAGHRYYWKSTNLASLPIEAIDRLVERTLDAPSKHSTVDIWLNGGAIGRVPSDATAFVGRDVQYVVNPEANWEHAEDDNANVSWARGVLAATEPYASGGAYLNFPGFLEEGQDLVRSSHGSNYERLVALKKRLDPENVFRRNANIDPSA